MFVTLWLFFILLSGKWTLEIVLFGFGIACLVFAFACAFMNWSFKQELQFMRRLPGRLFYAVRLFWEIVKTNFSMLRRIYSPKPVEPAIVTFRTVLKEEWMRVLLANSITLTPGTITLHMEDDRLTVHCLNRQDADTLAGGEMEKNIAEMGERK